MAVKKPDVTTLAVGEEEQPVTTLAVGEEDPTPRHERTSTTMQVGEESGGGGDGPPPTPYVEDGEDERRKARGVVPRDNPLGAF